MLAVSTHIHWHCIYSASHSHTHIHMHTDRQTVKVKYIWKPKTYQKYTKVGLNGWGSSLCLKMTIFSALRCSSSSLKHSGWKQHHSIFLLCFDEQLKEKDQRIWGTFLVHKPKAYLRYCLVQGHIGILKSIWKLTGYQCAGFKIGKMCALFLVLVSNCVVGCSKIVADLLYYSVDQKGKHYNCPHSLESTARVNANCCFFYLGL